MPVEEGELALCLKRQRRSVVLVARPLLRVLLRVPRYIHHDGVGALAKVFGLLYLATQRVDYRAERGGESGGAYTLPLVAPLKLAPLLLRAQHVVPAVKAQLALALQG